MLMLLHLTTNVLCGALLYLIFLNTAKGLSYWVFFYNCKTFGLQGNGEHENLDTSGYAIKEMNVVIVSYCSTRGIVRLSTAV